LIIVTTGGLPAIYAVSGCRLKKLQLGKNRLTKLDLMSCVTNLTQLSVEDNELSTLSGLEPLVNLMELYAGGCSSTVSAL
jgi:Leucine-rich repeat (LRR) protein